MKRFLLVFFTVLFLFLFCSLSANALTLKIPEYTTTDQEDCKDYIAEHKVEWVPSYEDFSFLGEWEKFIWYDLGQYERYSYIMKCPSGEGFHSIEYHETYGFDELSGMLSSCQESLSPSGGWLFPEESRIDNFYYKFGNFYYFYRYLKYEKRFSMHTQWFDEVKPRWCSISFSCSDTELCDFRKELMHVDTAQNAINRLLVATGFDPLVVVPPADDEALKTSGGAVDALPTDSIDTLLSDGAASSTLTDLSGDSSPFPWVWVIVPAGVVLIAAATTSLVIRKKKKQ